MKGKKMAGVDVEDFYRTYGPMVLRRCRGLLRNEEEALDAMQETFVRILRKQKQLDNRAPSSLLYITATNVCLNVIRAKKRRPSQSGDELLAYLPGSDDPAARAMDKHLLECIFAEEEDKTRAIAVLHYADGLTLEETAVQVGMSVSGIRKRLRGLRKRSLSLSTAGPR